VLEVVDSGGYTTAWQVINVSAGVSYTLSGASYFPTTPSCDNGCCTMPWCTSSVWLCSGAYDYHFYNRNDCYLSLHPAQAGWTPFTTGNAFVSTDNLVTIYLLQNVGSGNAYFRDLALQSSPSPPSSPPSLPLSPSPPPYLPHACVSNGLQGDCDSSSGPNNGCTSVPAGVTCTGWYSGAYQADPCSGTGYSGYGWVSPLPAVHANARPCEHPTTPCERMANTLACVVRSVASKQRLGLKDSLGRASTPLLTGRGLDVRPSAMRRRLLRRRLHRRRGQKYSSVRQRCQLRSVCFTVQARSCQWRLSRHQSESARLAVYPIVSSRTLTPSLSRCCGVGTQSATTTAPFVINHAFWLPGLDRVPGSWRPAAVVIIEPKLEVLLSNKTTTQGCILHAATRVRCILATLQEPSIADGGIQHPRQQNRRWRSSLTRCCPRRRSRRRPRRRPCRRPRRRLPRPHHHRRHRARRQHYLARGSSSRTTIPPSRCSQAPCLESLVTVRGA
jgi:hypothetical protein